MRRVQALALSLGLALAVGAFGACGSTADAPPSQTYQGGGSGAGGGGAGISGGFGGDASSSVGGISGLDGGKDVIAADAACAKVTEKATNTPLDLYIMLDKSSSMGGSTPGDKWNSSVAGLTAFVNDQASDGIRVALKFFPRKPDNVAACNQQAYATPDVPYGVLPNNAQPIIDALNAATADGLNTPTYPALGGAILGSITQKQNRPGDSAAVLLVTDGAPQGPATTCAGVNPESTQEIANLAAAGYKNYGVLTFVIALPGVPLGFAQTVAQAGGGTAISIGRTNVQQQFETALQQIRGQALPCTFKLPPQVPTQYSTDKVNVILTSGGNDTVLLQDPKCAKGTGWDYQYDSNNNPKGITLCSSTCGSVKKDYQAKIQIRLGCPTQKIF